LEALLKASEAAALMGVSARWVQVMAKKGGYSNVRVQANSRGRDIYLIPLSSLPDAAQQKYFAEHAPAALPAAAFVPASAPAAVFAVALQLPPCRATPCATAAAIFLEVPVGEKTTV